MSSFRDDVEAIVGPALAVRGFVLDQIDDNPDSGGRERHIVFYRSPDCRIQIYESSREGETNVMIATSDAHQFGVNSPDWQFLTRFTERPRGPLGDITQGARQEYEAYADPLVWVRDRIVRCFDAARVGILAMHRNDGGSDR
ncbi:hypothetical protein [Mycobacterium kyogaense]|uniref:hypothetical protein n=1 Tax=Mycobacterium kyogaense TaxID=2212479 RepID=UPI002FFBB3CA